MSSGLLQDIQCNATEVCKWSDSGIRCAPCQVFVSPKECSCPSPTGAMCVPKNPRGMFT